MTAQPARLAPPIMGTAMGHLCMFGSVTLWMVGLLVHKVLSQSIPLATILVWHLGVVAVLLWLITWLSGSARPSLWYGIAGIGRGAIAPGLVLFLNGMGAQYIDGTTMIAFWGLVPMLVPVFAWLTLREALDGTVMVGAIIAFAGVLTLALLRNDLMVVWWGVVLVAMAIVFSVCGALMGRFLNRNNSTWICQAALQSTGAFISLAIVALITGAPLLLPWPPTPESYLFIYLVLGMGVINFTAYNYGLGQVPAGFGMLYTALAPLIGALFGWLWLSETSTGLQFILLLSCLAGVGYPHLFRLVRGRIRRSRTAHE